MKVAIVGAGISGLAAGNELVKAGHEVVVFEKSAGYGGRMSTRYENTSGGYKFDHGVPYVESHKKDFQRFVMNLLAKDVLKTWQGEFVHRDDIGVIETVNAGERFISTEGMNQVGKHMSRMLDVRLNELVGGFTHIGEHRTRKRSWMVNFSSAKTESADAVIIATPARQAYALLNTTIDEIQTLTLVREIDEVEYDSCFTLMVKYANAEKPDWAGMSLDHDTLKWISNEDTKRPERNEGTFVIQTTPEFTHANLDSERGKITEKILEALADVLGGWAALPDTHQIHFWKYSRCTQSLPYDYMEIMGKEHDTPLALVGDYFNGNTLESAFLSGLNLGRHWAVKYSD